MPYNGSGTYVLPAGNPVVTGSTISATTHNNTYTDIASALSNCITRDGQSAPTANIPMGGFKHTGLAAGTGNGESVRYDEFNGHIIDVTAAHAASAIANTPAGNIVATDIQAAINELDTEKAALAGATFTGAVTLSGAINESRGTVAMHATTMDLWAQPNTIDGTGAAVVITNIVNAPQAGAKRTLYPIAGTTITHSAKFSVQGATSYVTAAGDALVFEAVTVSTYNVLIVKAVGSSGKTVGELFFHLGDTAPANSLIVPVAATNISRATYPLLHTFCANLGYPWGSGDGTTTFGMPWVAADYALIHANGNVRTTSVGQVISHQHTINGIAATGGLGSTTPSYTLALNSTSGATGGSANLAAGIRALMCVQYQ